jgi:hypothetical protein
MLNSLQNNKILWYIKLFYKALARIEPEYL